MNPETLGSDPYAQAYAAGFWAAVAFKDRARLFDADFLRIVPRGLAEKYAKESQAFSLAASKAAGL